MLRKLPRHQLVIAVTVGIISGVYVWRTPLQKLREEDNNIANRQSRVDGVKSEFETDIPITNSIEATGIQRN